MASHYVPYCGLPPGPGSVAWNLDPILISVLAVGAGLYILAMRRWPLSMRGEPAPGPLGFAAGWLVLAGSFISPLCNLSVALFSARIGQHMILILAAAPLLVLGGADILFARAFGFDASRRNKAETFAAPLLFAFVLWFWHMPEPYDATLQSHIVYWSMEISLLATGVMLWRCLLRDLSRNPGPAIAASLFTGLQMTGLGALLVFMPRAVFAAHFTTTEVWGLSPLQDQQLGGLIMWLPFGLILTVHLVGAVGAFMQALERKAEAI
ncbi:cytochrome c oxidase assembly protein [Methyloferula stellata]|uniref:cytochrome c oxidase assembly protein n=1 Tax=Methyloferula stellata TaxID=876270 RepID=UPI000368D32A|nr:cytochrome c oxidase assembly protein [Methyloferula stellata]